jgi:type IV pilus assembly protein PilB
MGVTPYAIATSVSLINAHRLERKLCDNCKEVRDVPKEALQKEGFTSDDIDHGLTIFGPVGCKTCNGGYKGRLGLFQVMEVSETMGRIIMEGGNAMQIADQSTKEGVIDLRRAGLNKVKEGLTSLEEINRVTIE